MFPLVNVKAFNSMQSKIADAYVNISKVSRLSIFARKRSLFAFAKLNLNVKLRFSCSVYYCVKLKKTEFHLVCIFWFMD